MNCRDIRVAIDTMSKRAPLSLEASSHLGECADCSRYADQTTALLSLLSAQPRVEAPSDFDFRLRARIARAEAEPRGVIATLEGLWAKSFSWGQAATAVATLALAVTLTTLFVDRTDEIVSPKPEVARVSEAPVRTAPVAIETAVPGSPESNAVAQEAATQRTIAVNASRASVPSDSNRILPIDNGTETMRVYNRERGQIIAASSRTTLIGAEAPAANLAKNASFVPSI